MAGDLIIPPEQLLKRIVKALFVAFDWLQKALEVKASDHTRYFSLKEQIVTYEKQIVMEALQTSRSIREAARRLGVSHTALLNKLKKWKHKEPMET